MPFKFMLPVPGRGSGLSLITTRARLGRAAPPASSGRAGGPRRGRRASEFKFAGESRVKFKFLSRLPVTPDSDSEPEPQ